MDLNSIFKFNTIADVKNDISDVVVSEDEVFLKSVKELYTIEGFSQPIFLSNSNYHDYLESCSKKIRNIIFDMRNTSDVEKITSEVITVLDVSVSLLIISDVDSILLQNKVCSLGGIYVLWDENLDGLLYSIRSDHNKVSSNIKQTRVAKRILVLGSKGGVGVSLISSLLSYSLSSKAYLKTLLVDYDSTAINSDIYSGIKGFKPGQNSKNVNQIEIDSVVAESYINKVSEKLDYLMLERNSGDFNSHTSALLKISSELNGKYNFIIDSVPANMFGEIYDDGFFERYHHIYIVCEPSIGSLRSCNNLKKKMSKVSYKIIINLIRPLKEYMLSVGQVKDKLKVIDTVDIPYEQGMEKKIIQYGIGYLEKSKIFDSTSLAILELTGKNINNKSKKSIFKI